jgi:alcohol dehydrogenase class IV
MAFQFRSVGEIFCEKGSAARLGGLITERFQVSRAMLVTDRGVMAAGLPGPAMASLAAAGLAPVIFADVVADPPEAVVHAAVAAAKDHGADIVIGLGGGSSMDVAKLVAVLLGADQSLAQIYGVGKVTGKRHIPLVQVPTTAGTGSEVTPIAVVTTGETTKAGIVAPQLYADLAVLDAELTMGLPPAVTAATGIDAMVHAIEAYTSRHRKNPLSDMLAERALKLLFDNLLAAVGGGDQALEAREAMLVGACLAGQAFANAPVAAVHALAYPIGGIFHVSHGLSNALMLGPVLRFNLSVASQSYAGLAEAIGLTRPTAEGFIEALETLMLRAGVQRRLRDVGVPHSALDELAAAAMEQTRLLVNNPRDVTLQDARQLYEAVW